MFLSHAFALFANQLFCARKSPHQYVHSVIIELAEIDFGGDEDHPAVGKKKATRFVIRILMRHAQPTMVYSTAGTYVRIAAGAYVHHVFFLVNKPLLTVYN